MRIEAAYEAATPMFCGGADPEKQAELRLASFKGALRFWWRALAWPRLGGRLEDIRREEDGLFGSAEGGQSRVLMKLDLPDGTPKVLKTGSVLNVPSRSNARVVGGGARYLGYGVMEAFGSLNKGTEKGQLTRACLQAPFRFTVQIRCRDLGGKRQESLENALIALGTFGGMGAKSRKGYGSLVLRSLYADGEERWKPPLDIGGLESAIRTLCGDVNGHALPEFTALSDLSRWVLAPGGTAEPLETLDLVGRELVRYRSWGRGGKILGSQRSEMNFKDDHDLMKGFSKGSSAHPQRIAFGLPHNYGKRQVGPWNDHRDSAQKKLDRRASPLFIHIHKCGAAPVAVLSFLPARFLPEGRADISVGRDKVKQKPEDELYRPINDFLDRLLDGNKRKEPFGPAVEVKP